MDSVDSDNTSMRQKYIRANQEMFMTKALNKTIILWSRLCNIEDLKIKMVSLEMPQRNYRISYPYRGGSRTAVIIVKVLHLGCCNSSRSASATVVL